MLAFEEIIKFFPEDMDKKQNARNIIKEYLQHIALERIMNDKLAAPLVFIGGTCLKYFHGIKRFSDDLDFDILPAYIFGKEQHNQLMKKVLDTFEKNNFTPDLKTEVTKNGVLRGKFFFPGLEYEMGTSNDPRKVVNLKIEAQAQGIVYNIEKKLLNRFGVFTAVNSMPLEYLFASKICTVIDRSKGRDFYDLVELSSFAQTNEKAIKQIFSRRNIKYSEPEDIKKLIKDKLNNTDWKEKSKELSMFLYDKNDIKKIKNIDLWLEETDFNSLVINKLV